MPAPVKKGTGKSAVRKTADDLSERAYGLIKKFAPKFADSVKKRGGPRPLPGKKLKGYREGTSRMSLKD